MTSDSSFPFSPETRAEITRRFGDRMADVVTGAMARALREVAADSERAGLRPEEAVVGFLHLCRDMHELLRRNGEGGPVELRRSEIFFIGGLFSCMRRAGPDRSLGMDSPQNPSAPSGKDESNTAESPRGEDREGENAGPGEKRHSDDGTPLESVSLSETEKNDAADWTKRTPASTPEKPGTENPSTYK